MSDPVEIVQGFDRPNIYLSVHQFHEESEKMRQMLKAITKAEPPGIVYAATRKATEEIAEKLRSQNIQAAAYHAGMSVGDHNEVQDQFIADKVDVIVATTAFGMGIDKPNVRFVYHCHIPGSVDAYYQAIGRAARDGEPAAAKLFYWPDDMKLQRFFSSGGQVDEETLSDLAALLENVPTLPTEDQLR
ncbi:ATP-dependent DNA helicase RecQ [Leptolyngbya sp. BC1307]|uniref:ATP-dependent DNA helicase RecQ n=1 Tax=Leptolyngbya sp. BC1307 TaxID=2029589 RepID=UPI001981DFC0|nr:ATP-dependent DNA helicase RecQ [Leptolyngbya sp. BC1307]